MIDPAKIYNDRTAAIACGVSARAFRERFRDSGWRWTKRQWVIPGAALLEAISGKQRGADERGAA